MIYEKIKKINMQAFKKGYNLLEKSFKVAEGGKDENAFINTNQVIAFKALDGGVCYYSAYSMTPSMFIMGYLVSKQEVANILVEQAEDEITDINMAIGASYTGVRAMTSSSGGVFF